MLIQAGEIVTSSSNSDEEAMTSSVTDTQTELHVASSETETHIELHEVHEELELVGEPSKKKKKLFKDITEEETDTDDPLPKDLQHLRESERKVRHEYYKTVANLIGRGLSIGEASSAVVEVGNTMFGRNWKECDESEETIDTWLTQHTSTSLDPV